MGEVTIPLLRHHLKATVDFLKPFLPVLDGHMTRFLSERLWQKHIPHEIQREIRTETDAREAIEIYRDHLSSQFDSSRSTDKYTHFRTHLWNTKQYYLDRFTDIWIEPNELSEKLKSRSDTKRSHPGFMPDKKHHEVN